MEVEDLPAKLMVLSSKITKRTSEIFIIVLADTDYLISDLIAKGQPCPTSSDIKYIKSTIPAVPVTPLYRHNKNLIMVGYLEPHGCLLSGLGDH